MPWEPMADGLVSLPGGKLPAHVKEIWWDGASVNARCFEGTELKVYQWKALGDAVKWTEVK